MTRQPPDVEGMKAFNTKIAEEFRANNGVVGGPFTAAVSAFAQYQANTKRVIPIFELQPVN